MQKNHIFLHSHLHIFFHTVFHYLRAVKDNLFLESSKKLRRLLLRWMVCRRFEDKSRVMIFLLRVCSGISFSSFHIMFGMVIGNQVMIGSLFLLFLPLCFQFICYQPIVAPAIHATLLKHIYCNSIVFPLNSVGAGFFHDFSSYVLFLEYLILISLVENVDIMVIVD